MCQFIYLARHHLKSFTQEEPLQIIQRRLDCVCLWEMDRKMCSSTSHCVALNWKRDPQILVAESQNLSYMRRASTGLGHAPEDAREPLRVQRDAIKKIAQYGERIIKEETKA